MSGVFGAFNLKGNKVLEEVYLGLYALQHRGQESAGVAWFEDGVCKSAKGIGLLSNAIDQKALSKIEAKCAIGHVRYVPINSSEQYNILPVTAKYARSHVAISHDGRIYNHDELIKKLEKHGAIFQSTTDSETIIQLMARKPHMLPLDAFIRAIGQVKGSYAVALLLDNSLIVARDPWGFKPLVLGKRQDTYYVSSESCALDIVGAVLVRDIEPGEVLVINENGLRSLRPRPKEKCRKICSFEYIFTARPDSVIDGRSVYNARKEMGTMLAEKFPCPSADFVTGVPDSGTVSAIGYSQQTGTPLELAIVRNRYIGRTFIKQTKKVCDLGMKMRFNPISEVFKGKSAVIVDDSIVRGSTAWEIIKLMSDAGAKEVHLRVASPPVKFACPYGLDNRKTGNLAASQMTTKELSKKLGAVSLEYLSKEDLVKAIGLPEDSLCLSCFTGKYLDESNNREDK